LDGRDCHQSIINSLASFRHLCQGSLRGAVIVLLTWFYITGFMLLLGAEINSEIEAAAAETRIAASPSLSSQPGPAQLVDKQQHHKMQRRSNCVYQGVF
jgi:uncharacterized BrkB/YihY/UPF0761 family membrane protein